LPGVFLEDCVERLCVRSSRLYPNRLQRASLADIQLLSNLRHTDLQIVKRMLKAAVAHSKGTCRVGLKVESIRDVKFARL